MTRERRPDRGWVAPVRPRPTRGDYLIAGRTDPDGESHERGEPLQPDVRARMEARLGEDFSGVRVRADDAAGRVVRGHHALAVSQDEQVLVRPDRYRPGTPAGDDLLAHELGHVVHGRHGAEPGIYRQSDAGGGTPASEAPVRGGRSRLRLDPGIGSLSLGLSTLDGFDFNSAALKPDHSPLIADVAAKLTMLLDKMPGGRVTVIGHTDLVGGEDVNLRIGQERADAVTVALMKAGVPPAAIRASSVGEMAPAVKQAGREPKNRRVEVRFEGRLIVPSQDIPGFGIGTLQEPGPDRPQGFDPVPPPGGVTVPPPGGVTVPSPGTVPIPPWVQPPAQKPTTPQTNPPPKGTDEPTRNAKAGDFLKAVTKIPEVKSLIDTAKEEQLRKLDKGTTKGEKVLLGTTVVSMATLTAAGISTDPAASKVVLELIDGQEVTVPGVPWLKIRAHTKGGGLGGGLQIDLVKIFPVLK